MEEEETNRFYNTSIIYLWTISSATKTEYFDDQLKVIDENIKTKSIDNYWALLALFLVLATAAGNILVCLAITWERRLQNVTNYFLMSLAITDLMVAILVMPLGILTLVRGEFFFFKANLKTNRKNVIERSVRSGIIKKYKKNLKKNLS